MFSAMRVGVVGTGAVGTYFGVRLAQLGHDVRFLLSARHEPPAVFAASSATGDFELAAPTVVRRARDLGAGGELDWVLVCLKSTALDGAGAGAVWDELVAPCVGSETRVQLLMNGLGAEEQAASRFGAEHVHGGLVYGGLTRVSTGRARHEGMPVELRGGSFVDCADELARASALWSSAHLSKEAARGCVAYAPQACLRRAQWAKLAWNVPFNGLTVAAGGCDVGVVWSCPDARETAEGLMREVIAAANADLAAHSAVERLDADTVVANLSAITDQMAAANYVPSTTLDFLDKVPMETRAIFLEPLRRAQNLKVDTPKLQTLTALLNLISRNTQLPPPPH